jgi:type I restriction enzyme R subunit
MVRLCINEFLDKLPQVYTPELYRTKCEAVYQHVYDSYGVSGESPYIQATGSRYA